MKEQYLLFNKVNIENEVGETAHDVVCYPVSKFKGFTNVATSNTRLSMIFEGMEEGTADGDTSSVDDISLTITANKHVEVIRDIVRAMNSSSNLVVIADKLNNEFASRHITTLTISVATAD